MSTFLNISYRDLSDQEKFDIADIVAADTLEECNANCSDVIFKETFYSKYGKRFLDIIFSFFALVISFPINFVLAICTFIDVGNPIFFGQKRIGKNCKIYQLKKFRNMTNDRDELGNLLPASERVTKFGKFVRKNSLDELLNFWYVFTGKMSIIGPRPMPDYYLHRFNKRHIKRHLVRPGLECPLHSTSYHGEMTWENRFENDIWYVQNISFKTDMMMVYLLIKDALFSPRRQNRGSAVNFTFIGYFPDGTIMHSGNIPDKYYQEIISRRNYKYEEDNNERGSTIST